MLLFACSSNNNKANNSASGGSNYGTITIDAGKPITIGLSSALSGGAAPLGKPISQGGELAVTQKGTIKGHPVQINIQDDKCDGPGSVAVANTFISDPSVAGVVGAMCSGGCVPSEQVYNSKHIVAISPSCTGVAVTQQSFDDILRVVPSDALQGAGQATFAKDDLKATKAVLINDQSIYAKGLSDIFKKNFADANHKVLDEIAIKVGDTDFSSIVTKIQSSGADLICFYGFVPEGTLMIQQIRKAGIKTNFIGGDGLKDEDAYIAKSQGAGDQTYITDAATGTTDATKKFAADFKTKYGADPGIYADTTFDAANVLMQAIESVAKDQSGKLVIDKKALVDAVHRASYAGVTGTVAFDTNGDRKGGASIEINQVQGAKFNLLKKVTP